MINQEKGWCGCFIVGFVKKWCFWCENRDNFGFDVFPQPQRVLEFWKVSLGMCNE